MTQRMSQIRIRLEGMAEKKNAEFSGSLGIGNAYPLLGVRIPQLRALGRELACRDDWREVLENEEILSYSTFEEVLLHAFIIGYAKMDVDERLCRIYGYVNLVNDWALCDCAVSTLKFKPCDYDKVWNLAAGLLRSHEEFRVRFGAVLVLSCLKSRERIDVLLKELSRADTSAFYAMMAVAWACAELFKLDNDRVLAFLAEGNFDLQTTRRAFSKICDSRTTSDACREKIKALRTTLK